MNSHLKLFKWLPLLCALLLITLGCQAASDILVRSGESLVELTSSPSDQKTTPIPPGAEEEIIAEPGQWLRATVTPGVGLYDRIQLAGQVGGNTYAVALQGATAFLGVGPRLVALDLSDPAQPRLLGQSAPLPGVVRGVALQGNYAYVAAGKGYLRVLDISNPAAPAEVGAVEEFQWAMAVVTDGQRLYVADNAQGLWIADLADPAQPRLLGTYQLKQPAAALAARGDTVFVVHMSGGLVAIDVRDPANPLLMGELSLPEMSASIALSGNYACIAAGMEGLWVVDITNPAALQKVGALKTTWADGVAVDGALAYLTDNLQGLLVIDIANPLSPAKVGSLPLTLFSQQVPGQRQVIAQGGLVLLANPNQGLLLVDATQFHSPRLLSSYEAPLSGAAFDAVTSGSVAFVTRDFIGLGAVEVTDPANLSFLGSESSFVQGAPVRTSWKLAVSGSHAFLTDVNLGFRVVDISDPTQPVQVAGIDTPRSLSSITLQGNLAYVTSIEHDPPADDPEAKRSLRVIDISNPLQPTQVGLLKMEYNAHATAIQGQYLYYPDFLEMKELSEGATASLHVIDIANPTSPFQVGELNITDSCATVSSIVVNGEYAYLGDQKTGLCVVDISDPSNPKLAGVWSEGAMIYDMHLSGDRLFAACYSHVIVLDISDPLKPHVQDVTTTPGLAWGAFAVASDVADQFFVADMDGGLVLLTVRR